MCLDGGAAPMARPLQLELDRPTTELTRSKRFQESAMVRLQELPRRVAVFVRFPKQTLKRTSGGIFQRLALLVRIVVLNLIDRFLEVFHYPILIKWQILTRKLNGAKKSDNRVCQVTHQSSSV